MNKIKNIFQHKQKESLNGGGKVRIEAQKKLGKKTARERIDLLLDPHSFQETDLLVCSKSTPLLPTDGVITGFGRIHGRKIALYAQDFTIKGGSLGAMHAKKIIKIMDIAAKIGCPIIGVIDSGGARIDEGVHALAGYGEIFLRNVRYSGVIPQISIVLGPCAGGAAYSPALTDFIFTTESISQLFITGPHVIKQVLHTNITKDELGGSRVHAQKSGLVHHVAHTEEECFEQVKTLLSYLPDNYLTQSKQHTSTPQDTDSSPESLVPTNAQKAYDIKHVINTIVDDGSFFELQALYAPNIVIGFARMQGETIALIANQPMVMAGTLNIDASCKAARFINFCDSFSIPIISFVDVPGYLPGVEQEHNGIIRHGAKLLAAYAQATVPKITIILRKAYGGAYIVMGSKHLETDFNFAWPSAQIAVLGAQAAVHILHRKELNACTSSDEKNALQKEREHEYEEEFLNPFIAAESGYIDAIIQPNETRNTIIRTLDLIRNKVELLPKRKHANIPL